MRVAEDLLGIQVDTQMLAKLALSVAGVLLVSWAYRFYNSRRWHVRRDGPGTQQADRLGAHREPDAGTSSEGSADNCEEELLRSNEVSPRETLLQQCKHSPREAPNIPSPGEMPLEQCMHSPEEPQNILSVGETFSDQREDSPGELHNIPSSGETFSDQYEDSPPKPQSILPPGETFLEKYKYSSVETQSSAYLGHVEPDVAIVRGEENLNHNPNLPTKESMVRHDPPKIKQTPVAHDRSTQGALHTNCEEAEGWPDADLVLDTSLSPPPMEDLDHVGVSPTGRRSPCKQERLELSTSMGQELRQDLGHLGNSSHLLTKEEVRTEGTDYLQERDGDAPVEAHGSTYDNHIQSSLQSVSDESLLASPSIQNLIGELQEDTTSHDPLSLKQPEVSSYHDGKAIHQLSHSLTPPLNLQDLVLPSVQEHSFAASLDPPSPGRQGLVRKDSYIHIVENDDLQIPFLNPRASTSPSMLSSQTLCSEGPCSKPHSPVKDPTVLGGDTSEETGLEGAERLTILQIPKEGSSPELERLQGRLDLGNCLHTLSLARKEGHASLQHAALKVMSDNYLQVLQDPGLYGSLKGGDRDLIQKLRTRGKRCLVVADLDQQDLVGSDSGLPKTSSSLYYYDDLKDSWNFLCPLPKEVVSRGSAMCVMDNYLFVTLGCQGLGREVQPSRRAFCYNPATSIWKEISPMNEARPQCKLVALGGYVYAIGGECLSSVERYDPRTGRWAFVASMPNDTFAVAHRATVCNGELFVSGGTLRYTLLRYNPATNTWRRSLIVGSKERTIEMVAVKNFLYRFDVGSTSGVSVYRYHVAARFWYECCSRKLPRCLAFQCAVIDDVIYCVSRQATMRFLADEVSPAFIAEDFSVPSEAKGTLFPFILVLPEMEALQTSV